jgi:hypothetical protein
MERDAISLERQSGFEHSPALQKGQPRWKVGPKWIEFECGCIAERTTKLVNPEPYDPIIFQDLVEDDGTSMQAVYYRVCAHHEQGMFDTRIKFSHRIHNSSGYSDFNDWFNRRRPLLMG